MTVLIQVGRTRRFDGSIENKAFVDANDHKAVGTDLSVAPVQTRWWGDSGYSVYAFLNLRTRIRAELYRRLSGKYVLSDIGGEAEVNLNMSS